MTGNRCYRRASPGTLRRRPAMSRARRFVGSRVDRRFADLAPARPDRRSCPAPAARAAAPRRPGTRRRRCTRAAPDSTSMRSSGNQPPTGRRSGVCRVTATARPASGRWSVTGQSLPKPMRAPLRSREPMGYWWAERRGPSRGTVSSSIAASVCAQSGWKLATTPSCANRGRSAGSTTCECANIGRRSRIPLRCRTNSMASSALRTAASPITCRWTCRFIRSTSTRAARSSVESQLAMPRAPGSSAYGASIAAVRFSMMPSRKNFTVRAASRACPATRRRSCAN